MRVKYDDETPALRATLDSHSPVMSRRYLDLEEGLARNVLPFTTPLDYTDHGLKHGLSVQENLRRLIPASMPDPLSAFEMFALMSATLLHDVGMILTKDEDEQISQVRVDHYLRSQDFVLKNRNALRFSEHEAVVIGELCRAHGMPTLSYLDDQPYSLMGHGAVRVDLLSALLRLADYLDLTAQRAPEILATSRFMPASSRWHWDLHRCIMDVLITSAPSWDIAIIANLLKPADEPKLLGLRNSVQLELDTISDVLRANGLFFKRIDLKFNTALLDTRSFRRKNPFLRLASFSARDTELFAGRDNDIGRLVEKLTGRSVVVVVGESGVGKTSLVEAGVIPRMKSFGYTVARFSFQEDPISSLVSALLKTRKTRRRLPSAGRAIKTTSQPELLTLVRELCKPPRSRPLLVIGDHLEQMFTVGLSRVARRRFVQQMARVLGHGRVLPVTFLFCIRQDYLPDLHDLSTDIPELYDRSNTYRLQRLSREQGREVLERASRYARAIMTTRLIDRVVQDLCDGGDGMVYPPFLQIVGYSIYASLGRGEEQRTPEDVYKRLGGAEKIVSRYLDGLLDSYSKEERPQIGKILGAMVTEHHTKKRTTRERLRRLLPDCQRLDRLLASLVQHRIIRRTLGEYELIHDFLAQRVIALLSKQTFLSRPVRQALEFIEENYNRPGLSSAEIAVAVGVTQSHLAVLFRRQLGRSINEQLNWMRVEAAKKLLGRSRDPVKDVSVSVGFKSLSSFSRKFAQIEKISPLAFRKSLPRSVSSVQR
jgi:AraC-like DNA-binding protein